MPTGRNRVPIAQLREVLTDAGYGIVRTYIQSGNVLVDTHLSAKEAEEQVHELIKEHIGADITVIVRTGRQLQQVRDENPFIKGYDISRVFFVIFAESPSRQKVKELMAEDYGDEKLFINQSGGYMFIPGSAARSRLSNVYLEKKLGVSATTRNFNTMSKLIELSRAKK